MLQLLTYRIYVRNTTNTDSRIGPLYKSAQDIDMGANKFISIGCDHPASILATPT